MSTAVFMVAATAVLIGIDVWLLATGRKSYSQVIRALGLKYPLFVMTLVFALGVLSGHWFW